MEEKVDTKEKLKKPYRNNYRKTQNRTNIKEEKKQQDKELPDEEIEMSIKRAKVDIVFCEENYLDVINGIISKGETNLKQVI